MGFLTDAERDFATAVSHLAYVNPFLPERIEWERRALGKEHVPFDRVWHARGDVAGENPNEARIVERSAALAEALRARLFAALGATGRRRAFDFYAEFAGDCERFLAPAGGRLDPAHLFACCFQVRRAFHATFHSILGGSLPVA